MKKKFNSYLSRVSFEKRRWRLLELSSWFIVIKSQKPTKEMYSRTSTNGHLSTTATFLVNSPYTDSCLTTFRHRFPLNNGHFLLTQRGRCREVQLY